MTEEINSMFEDELIFLAAKETGLRRRLALKLEKSNRRAGSYWRKNNDADAPRSRFRSFGYKSTPFSKTLIDSGRAEYSLDESLDLEFDSKTPEGAFAIGIENLLTSTAPSINYVGTSGDFHLKHVPWRTKRDLKPHASRRYRNDVRKHPSKYKHNPQYENNPYRYFGDRHTLRKRVIRKRVIRKHPFRQKSKSIKPSVQSKHNHNLPLEGRVILDIGSVYKAGTYIASHKAVSQQFYHPHPQINGAVGLDCKFHN